MMKDLRKLEKSLGDDLIIPQINEVLTIRYKIEYHDKHFQRNIIYIGPCSDGLFRAAYHTNSSPKIRIVNKSRALTYNLVLSKMQHRIKNRNQIKAQWV